MKFKILKRLFKNLISAFSVKLTELTIYNRNEFFGVSSNHSIIRFNVYTQKNIARIMSLEFMDVYFLPKDEGTHYKIKILKVRDSRRYRVILNDKGYITTLNMCNYGLRQFTNQRSFYVWVPIGQLKLSNDSKLPSKI